jgi:ferrous-iron efflux pump FieF
MLDAVAYAATRMVAGTSWRTHVHDLLNRLGRATAVSRDSVFEMHTDGAGAPVQSCRFDWREDGTLDSLASDPRYSNMPLADEGLGMVIMATSILLTLALVWWQGRVARRTGSKVIAADRLHYLGDLLPNIGALLSRWASSKFGLASIDSIVALGAAAMLMLGAFKIGKGAWDALMDRRADPEIVAGIGRIAQSWPGVHGYHDLKTRTAGSRVFVNIHIELDGDQSLRDAHAIGAGLRRAILDAYPQADVIVHKDVVNSAHKPFTPQKH